MNIGEALPKHLKGSVHLQWVRCSRRWCRCTKNGLLHGPYYYRFWREKGRLRKQYIKAAEAEKVRSACAAYREDLRAQRQTWNATTQFLRDCSKYLRAQGL